MFTGGGYMQHLDAARAATAKDLNSGQFSGSAAAARLNAFAEGNARLGGPSSVGGLHEEFASRIEKMTADMPPEIRSKFKIYSGFRDAARQAQVHPSVTNSHHTGAGVAGTGMAVDVIEDKAVLNWILHNGPRHGVGLPLANDPKEFHHMEPLENGQRIAPGDMAEWARTHARARSDVASSALSGGDYADFARRNPGVSEDEYNRRFKPAGAAATARNNAVNELTKRQQTLGLIRSANAASNATSNDNSVQNDVNVGDVHVHGVTSKDPYAFGSAVSNQIKRDLAVNAANTGLTR
jgi:hypothetical protein